MSRIISRDQLRHMTPEQIEAARQSGLLDDLLAGTVPEPEPEVDEKPAVPRVPTGPRGHREVPPQLSRSDLFGMSPEQIDRARRDGRLDELLSGR